MAPYTVVHADDHIIVANKFSGCLVTPAHGEAGITDLLNQRFAGPRDLAVVHRLDKLTSGLVVFARRTAAAAHLAKQFAGRGAHRQYAAIARGAIDGDVHLLSYPLDGKRALTRVTVVRRADSWTFVEVRIETGRRNQIRHHMAMMGHPLLGDHRIGGESAQHPDWTWPRIALHACHLKFVHPATGRSVAFEAPLPEEFEFFMGTDERKKLKN
jgi:23S rRNA pseudouridine1911/1915/1917 synthase